VGPQSTANSQGREAPVLIVACGALARELRAVLTPLGTDSFTIEYLPAALHNRPENIPARVDALLDGWRDSYRAAFVAYADCGTGGRLDAVLARHGVGRLPGAHCYEFFAGADVFAALHEEQPGTFYLTDYLARHFDALVWQGLGLDRHPDLLGTYFAHYERVVWLRQSGHADLEHLARAAAARLELEFAQIDVGLDPFASAVRAGAQ
jgi:Protein of unknown function (DUF1638)